MERKEGDNVEMDLEKRKRSPARWRGCRKRDPRGWVTGCWFQQRYLGGMTTEVGVHRFDYAFLLGSI